jgi:hypothetical protein
MTTYSVVRSHRDVDGEWETIEDSGMEWETARAAALLFDTRERDSKPLKSSWTRDVFYCVMEDTDRWRELSRAIVRPKEVRK